MDYSSDTHSRFESGIPGDSVKGHYTWSDGHKIYRVDYTADHNGYRPVMTTRLVGADDQHQHQKPVAPAALPPQQVFVPDVVAQKPQPVHFEPAVVPIASPVPIIPVAAPAPLPPPAPVPAANPPIHVTDDAVIIEADYANAENADQNKQNQPKVAYDLILLDYIHQLLQYQEQLVKARQYLEKFQQELIKSYGSLSRDQIQDLEYEQLAKQFSFMSREDYEYEQLAKQFSFLPQSDEDKPAEFRYILGADYSRQLWENEQQLQQVQHQLTQVYNYLGYNHFLA